VTGAPEHRRLALEGSATTTVKAFDGSGVGFMFLDDARAIFLFGAPSKNDCRSGSFDVVLGR
jgi:hypothetical protein